MRKYLVGIFSLLIIFGSGCSFDFGSSDEMVKKLGALVDERNQMLNQLKSDLNSSTMNQAIEKLEKSREDGTIDQQAIETIVAEINKAKAKREQSIKKTKIIQHKAVALKKEINGLSADNQKLAQQALDHFIDLVDKEASLYEVGVQMDQKDLAYYEALKEKERPVKDQYDQLVKKQQSQQLQTEEALSKFNNSWNQFHHRVTGLHTKQPSQH